jgi:hypothetical protein
MSPYLQWIAERIAALEEDRAGDLRNSERKAAVLEPHHQARHFFEGLLRLAE